MEDDKDRHKRDRFVLSVAYSPDGLKLACGVMDGTVAVYDVTTSKQLGVLEGHHKPVRSLCFTPGTATAAATATATPTGGLG